MQIIDGKAIAAEIKKGLEIVFVEQIQEVELRVNQVIHENLPVQVKFPTNMLSLPMRIIRLTSVAAEQENSSL